MDSPAQEEEVYHALKIQFILMKKFILVFLLLVLFFFNISAQEKDSLLLKAWMYYEYEEPEMALSLVLQYLEKNKTDAEALKLAGNCYTETGNFERAFKFYYQALSVDSSYSDIYYNLGNVYDKLEMLDSAVFFFGKFIENQPSDINGYIRLAILQLDAGNYEDALNNAELASLLEPDNSYALYILSMVYYAMGNYSETYRISNEAINKGLSGYLLYQSRGLSAFSLSEYKKAYLDFSEAVNLYPENTGLIDLKAQSMLIMNMDDESFLRDIEGNIKFREYTSSNLKKIKKEVKNRKSLYYYNKLLVRFREAPLQFGLADFFMLYIGISIKGQEIPSDFKINEAKKFLEEHLYERAIEAANLELQVNPASFYNYLYLAIAAQALEDFDNYYSNIFKYYGFLDAIKASGNGETEKDAFIITDPDHKYDVFNSLGHKFENQKIISNKSGNYEVLIGTDSSGKPVNVYFIFGSRLPKDYRSRKVIGYDKIAAP